MKFRARQHQVRKDLRTDPDRDRDTARDRLSCPLRGIWERIFATLAGGEDAPDRLSCNSYADT